MADIVLDTKALNIQTQEFSSTDLFDSLEDDGTTPIPKKKPIQKEKQKDENNEEDEFEVKNSSLGELFPEENEEEEEDDLPVPGKKESAKKEEKEEKEEEEEQIEKIEEEDVNPFNVYAKELVNLGIFHPEDDEDELTFDSPQEFAERWQYEFRKAAREDIERYLRSRGDEATEWFDAVFNKGVKPKEYMQQYATIEDIVNLDMEDESNQERVVRELLKQQGFEPEDIKDEITKLKNIGELESTSLRYHKTLVKRESAKLQEMKNKSAEEERQKSIERENYKITLTQLLNTKLKTKEFDGIPLNNAVASEAFDSLYNYKYVSPDGKYLTQFDKDIELLDKNPEMKLKLGILLNMLKKDPSLSALRKKAVSKESNEAFQDLVLKKKTLMKKQTPIENINEFGA